jgi:pyruvate,orthophosphate dikinase
MIYFFDHDHAGNNAEVVARVGGKGASLWAMTTQLKLPVPPGFTLGTRTDRTRLSGEDVRAALDTIGAPLGRRFGDPERPLLVSVRSGSAVSMPGMMDTVLNVGLTAETTEGLARLTSDRAFAQDSYHRFLQQFLKTVLYQDTQGDIATLRARVNAHVPVDDPIALLNACIEAVFRSWDSPRARVYREHEGISHDLGTAVTIQAMVFGNLDDRSGTGVAFTRDPSTGAAHPTGDWLPRAQGEDVVAGTHATQPLGTLEQAHPQAWAALSDAMTALEAYYRDLVDIEFTIEAGKLWILQARPGKRSPAAAARIAIDLVQDPAIRLSRAEALARVPADLLSGARHIDHARSRHEPLTTGLGVSPGLATGKLVLTPEDAVELAEAGEDVILVRRETSPEDVHGMAVAKGVITTLGGLMSHAAVVARAWGLPTVCGAEAIQWSEQGLRIGALELAPGVLISLDGASGAIYLGTVDGEHSVDPALATLQAWAADLRQEG